MSGFSFHWSLMAWSPFLRTFCEKLTRLKKLRQAPIWYHIPLWNPHRFSRRFEFNSIYTICSIETRADSHLNLLPHHTCSSSSNYLPHASEWWANLMQAACRWYPWIPSLSSVTDCRPSCSIHFSLSLAYPQQQQPFFWALNILSAVLETSWCLR